MSILVIAPHADDEVLGAGATIARRVAEGIEVNVAVLTGHGEAPHPLWPAAAWDVSRAECRTACAELGVMQVHFEELPAACLDTEPTWRINQVVKRVIERFEPTELYLPFPADLHRDHAVIGYGAVVATRPYLPTGRTVRRVLYYETLSETHLAPVYLEAAFEPNLFVDVSDHMQCKLAALACYASQLQPDGQPRSLSAVQALATLRGSHIGVAAAEAFVVQRIVE